MIKKLSKFLLIMFIMFVVLSYSFICFADEEHSHEDTNSTVETNDEVLTTGEANTEEPEIHTGDLYVFDNKIVMDKYVDGNVFLFGNDIEITGRVNGNLFVFGDNVKFNEAIVRYSIFACANSVYYNGGCGTEYDYGNLYVAASNFEATYDSYVTGDVKAVASNTILKAAIYRDVDLISNNINLGEGTDILNVYGNFRYTSNREITIPEGVVAGKGTVTYNSTNDITVVESISDILIGFITSIVTVLALYIILNKLTPKFIEKIYNSKFYFVSVIKAFGIGLATIAIVLIVIILLIGTIAGASLSILLALIFAILYIISMPVLTIKIANTLKPALKIEKTSIFYLVIVLVSIILHGITLIPFVGGILGLIINITAIGLVVDIFLPHKELTEEEILALEEIKKEAKENKEKIKQEKLEAKEIKKAKKLELKESKKKDN